MNGNKNNNNNGKKNNNGVAAAAVGGAIIGAGAAALATKALSDPKNRKKVHDAFDDAKSRLLDALADLQNVAGDATENVQEKVEEGKVEARKVLKSGAKKKASR